MRDTHYRSQRSRSIEHLLLPAVCAQVVDRFGYEVVCLLHLRVYSSAGGKFRAAILHLKPMPYSRVALDAVKRVYVQRAHDNASVGKGSYESDPEEEEEA